jgi:hypothetical protein
MLAAGFKLSSQLGIYTKDDAGGIEGEVGTDWVWWATSSSLALLFHSAINLATCG